MGDLFATCSSPLSRNHTFGTNLGRGMTLLETIAATRQSAEGVKSCESVLDLARRHGSDMPITEVWLTPRSPGSCAATFSVTSGPWPA